MLYENDVINIRAIQHFMYCPRRYALLEINDDWSENVYVVKANIMHENVHSGRHEVKGGNRVELSSVRLYNDELNLYGVADCIEFIKSSDGIYIEGLCDKYSVNVIEYKPTMPKGGRISETDAMQVFAQKLCADYIWGCNASGTIYYADTKKRIALPFESEYESYFQELKVLLGGMRKCIQSKNIPPRRKGQKCSGCSMKDLCMPKAVKYSVREMVSEEVS